MTKAVEPLRRIASGLAAMDFVTTQNITTQVLAVMAKTPDPRLREITSA